MKNRMICIFMGILLVSSGCQESWQDKMVRTTREISIKQCPHYLTEGLIVDSMAFVPKDNARHMYYTLVDSLIDLKKLTTDNMSLVHKALVEEIRNDATVHVLKRHRCSFIFHYRLQSDSRTVFADSITASEY